MLKKHQSLFHAVPFSLIRALESLFHVTREHEQKKSFLNFNLFRERNFGNERGRSAETNTNNNADSEAITLGSRSVQSLSYITLGSTLETILRIRQKRVRKRIFQPCVFNYDSRRCERKAGVTPYW